jgi:hypothetical protein
MASQARPPAVVIRLPLEASPAVTLESDGESAEARMREHLAANLDTILGRIAASLERAAGLRAMLVVRCTKDGCGWSGPPADAPGHACPAPSRTPGGEP